MNKTISYKSQFGINYQVQHKIEIISHNTISSKNKIAGLNLANLALNPKQYFKSCYYGPFSSHVKPLDIKSLMDFSVFVYCTNTYFLSGIALEGKGLLYRGCKNKINTYCDSTQEVFGLYILTLWGRMEVKYSGSANKMCKLQLFQLFCIL